MHWKLLALILIVVVIGIAGYHYVSKNSAPVALSVSPSMSVSDSVSPEASVSASPSDMPSVSAAPQKHMIRADMITAKGTIELELFPDAAPKTVANFVKLSTSGFYNGIKFHRVVPGFVIQGGDPLSKTDDPRVGSGGPGYSFEDEINPASIGVPASVIQQLEAQGYVYNTKLTSLPMTVGALAMANAGPNTNGSQFFIVTDQDQPYLNGKHTVFGKVIKGMDVVHKIVQGDIIKEVKILK